VKLSARLWLFGAALPVAVLAAVLGVSDRLFHGGLEQGLDQALLSQAAVESVSLFDGPHGQPHLHMASSPLTESVRPFAPEGTLFGPDGAEVTRYPPRPDARERLLPEGLQDVPTLTTRLVDGAPRRELVVTVKAPDEQTYVLRLSASMEQLARSVSTFHQAAVLSTLVAALVLVIVQWAQGRRLRVRLRDLHRHIELVQRGQFDQPLPPETERDEVADLRLVLASATRELKRAHDSWERLLADAAHELRTPLTLMRTSLDLALRRERSAEELKEALRDTRQEVDRLAVLSARLLDTVAVGRGDFGHEPSDLVALAREAVAAAQAESESRGLVIKLVAPASAMALVDAGSIRQALDNLLSNALRFAPVGSEVTVTLETRGAGVALSVADTGPGIPAGEREAVFEPFHQATGERRGAGLGLTIVREAARQHGGRAYVVDSPRGTTVTIELNVPRKE
jgi:signal transduction histidine kinase